MLNKSAVYLVGLLEKHYQISQEEQPIYIYGFELLLSTLSSMVSIVCISLLINKPIYSVIFFLFFFTLRLFCGGYHANTYFKCFITTNAIFVSTILLTELFLLLQIKWIIPILVIISLAIVWVFSPIKNKHHPCSEETHRKNKRISRSLSSVYSLIFIYIYTFTSLNNIAVNIAWSLTMVSVMIIIEKLRLMKEVKFNEFYQFNDCWSY